MYNFDGKTILITGCSSGIGRALSEHYKLNGANVLGIDLKEPTIDIDFYKTDITDFMNFRHIIEKVSNKYKNIDIVLANAGVVPKWSNIYETDYEEWDEVFKINVKGVVITIKECFEMLKINGGSIVITGSINSVNGHSKQNLYTASKHALVGILKCSSIDLGRHNIRINMVGPGPVLTEAMNDRLDYREKMGTAKKIETINKFKSNNSLNQITTEKDVVDSVMFLTSEYSKNINGQFLQVCGGTFRME